MILHPAYDVQPPYMSLGFKRHVWDAGKVKAKYLFVISTQDHRVLVKDDETSFEDEGVKIVFDVEGRLPKDVNERWDAAMLQEFGESPCAPTGLYRQLKLILNNYIDFSRPGYAGLGSLCIMNSYFTQAADAVPFIFVFGQKRSGKSTFLDIISYLGFTPQKMDGVTLSGISRYVDQLRGVCVIDQAELIKEDIRLHAFLTGSYTKQGGTRLLTEYHGKTAYPVELRGYGQKVFASVDPLPTDLLDRCVQINMIPARREYPTPDPAQRLWKDTRDKLYRYALMKWPEFIEIYRNAGSGTSQRVRQLWRPFDTLLRLECVDQAERDTVYTAFQASMQQTQVEVSPMREELLNAVLRLTQRKSPQTLTAKEIAFEMRQKSRPVQEHFPKSDGDKPIESFVGREVKTMDLFDREERNSQDRLKVFTLERVSNIAARFGVYPHISENSVTSVINLQDALGENEIQMTLPENGGVTECHDPAEVCHPSRLEPFRTRPKLLRPKTGKALLNSLNSAAFMERLSKIVPGGNA